MKITDEKIKNFSATRTENQEYFYGYPLLYYKDFDGKKELVAPLLIMKVAFIKESNELCMVKDDVCPTCGVQAFKQLGLKIEEISNINQLIQQAYKNNALNGSQQCLNEILAIVKAEININIIEEINVNELTNTKQITEVMGSGLYNKSVLFSEEPTVFNMHLIKDLIELKEKKDIENTSLKFFSNLSADDSSQDIIPVLPFPANEYQVAAIKDIFKNSLSVITGPPGTGKSQFISNLIVNLFLTGKSVLFVSHTGEAVDVVNSKINEQFNNLMLRTGKKELRQDLKGRFNELIANYSKKESETIKIESIRSL
jgi:predicted ATP-dependent serine protease